LRGAIVRFDDDDDHDEINDSGEIGLPCLVPSSAVNDSPNVAPIFTASWDCAYRFRSKVTSFSGTPTYRIVCFDVVHKAVIIHIVPSLGIFQRSV